LDIVYYAGTDEADPNGSLRRARSVDGGRTFGASSVAAGPLTFTAERASRAWLGDYIGAAWAGDALAIAYADNESGTSHVRFARVPSP
jgi:hypothetical protein